MNGIAVSRATVRVLFLDPTLHIGSPLDAEGVVHAFVSKATLRIWREDFAYSSSCGTRGKHRVFGATNVYKGKPDGMKLPMVQAPVQIEPGITWVSGVTLGQFSKIRVPLRVPLYGCRTILGT